MSNKKTPKKQINKPGINAKRINTHSARSMLTCKISIISESTYLRGCISKTQMTNFDETDINVSVILCRMLLKPEKQFEKIL